MAYGSLGRFSLARERWKDGWLAAEAPGNRVIQSYLCVNTGHVFREQGDWAEAFARTQEGIVLSAKSENLFGLHYCRVHNGCADFKLGNREQGIATCREGIQGLLSFGVPRF